MSAFKPSRFWILFLILSACSSWELNFDPKELDENEFDKVVKIEQLPVDNGELPQTVIEPIAPEKKLKSSAKVGNQKAKTPKSTKKKISKELSPSPSETQKPSDKAIEKKQSLPEKPIVATKEKIEAKEDTESTEKREPEIEDSEGFVGRRPIIDPYQVGEEVVLGISYFAMEAGKFTMQVRPMVQVNGRKSYHFRYLIQTSPLFSMFYKVEDVAETFVDYEKLLPYSYEIHVKESKQKRETRTFFDHEHLKAVFWDRKKLPNKKEVEKKKVEWDLLPFSQNVFSAAYYLRNFTLKVGKELKVRVGHEGKNIVMTAKVLRKETLYTDAGKFETFVVKPRFDIDGKFKPTGENYLWLTADDRKYIVRLESKIRIGSIVGEVQKIKR